MAHHYTTKAFVLGTRNAGESNSVCTLFTKEFGLIYGSARSSRKGGAKLVGNLQPLTLADVTLVRGKKGWNIVGSLEEENFYYLLRNQKEVRELLVRLVKLVKRLVRGEERNESLFMALNSLFDYTAHHNDFLKEQIDTLERLVALRILAALGYRVPSKEFFVVIQHAHISHDDMSIVQAHRSLATREINRALKEAQL